VPGRSTIKASMVGAATTGLAQGRTIVVRDVAALVRIAETDLSCPTACNRFPAKEPAGPRF
jgi:hypothetical protein